MGRTRFSWLRIGSSDGILFTEPYRERDEYCQHPHTLITEDPSLNYTATCVQFSEVVSSLMNLIHSD
jgi:hypothetical protein